MSNQALCIQIPLLLHDIQRSPDDFLVDVRDIEPDEPERHEYDPDHDGIDDDDNPEVCEAETRDSDLVQYLEEQDDTPEARDSKPDISHEFEGKEGKRSQIVDGETDKFPIAVARFAVEAFFGIEYECDLTKSEPVDESAVHAVFLTEAKVGIHHAPVEQAVVGRPWFQFEFRHRIEECIEKPWGDSFQERSAMNLRSAVVDDIVILLPFFQEFRNPFDRVLSVGIERDDRVPVREFQPGGDGELLPEVSAQIDSFYPCIRFTESLYGTPSVVRTPVIHKNDLVFVFIGEVFQNGCEFPIYERNILFFPIRGYDYGDEFFYEHTQKLF